MKTLAICSMAVLLHAGVAETQDKVLFSDDFSVRSDRWDVGEWDDGTARYVGETMLVRSVSASDKSTFVDYDRIFTDHVIQVETTLVGGTDDNWQTVSCRITPNGNYYDLGISADGYFLLDVWVDGRKLNKSLGPTRSRHIRLGRNVVNVLRVECVGNTLRLSVNGHVLAEINDDNHARGKSLCRSIR